MKDMLLPIGSVVILKNANKRLMITGYFPVDKNDVYDYCGCSFPEGIFDSNKNALFNHSQIEKVFYKGYYDDESEKFFDKLNQIVSDNSEK